VFALQQEYAPQEAAQQVALAQQYAGPLGEALKTAQESMYPEETAFTKEALATAKQGMESGLPDWAKQSYMDTMRGQLGDNALAGVGADYMSTGLNQQTQDWKNYYTNLGLSISGKQPVYTANQPQTSNYTSGFTPNSVMSSNNQTYSTAANLYGQTSNQSPAWLTALTGMGGSVLGGLAGGWAMSSIQYKKNVKSWA
jgi:hypothetical protein